MVRTRVEVQEQTEVGDALVRGLIRAQLGLALRLGTLVFGTLAVIALLDSVFPSVSELTVLGFRPNWLILGVLVYPAMYTIGRLFVRLAEQSERDFVRVVDGDREDS
jgi:nucleoside permease NupC